MMSHGQSYSTAIVAYSTAKGYVQSAYLIMTNRNRYQAEDDTSFYLSFHMLCAFAAELYLKAFLSQKGYDERKLRSVDMRHNLENLWEMALSEGLDRDKSKSLIDLLSEHHKSFEFRYMKSNSTYRAIDLRSVFSAFSSLDVAVDTAVGASVSRGIVPGG